MNETKNPESEYSLQQLVKNLQRRHFEAYACESQDEVLAHIERLIAKDDVISWGGSVTLDEIGIKARLEGAGYRTIDRDKARSPEERKELVRKSLTADVFLMSANALTYDGEVVNMDGHGNRLAALCFGPRRVIMVVGVNRIAPDLPSAIARVRTHAAPANARRVSGFMEVRTPCLHTGSCHDCKSLDSIMLPTAHYAPLLPRSAHLRLLVNERLGF